ncbi:MAG TPA: hypothetical protein VIP70_10905 [Nitrososphaeraceae archaeon]
MSVRNFTFAPPFFASSNNFLECSIVTDGAAESAQAFHPFFAFYTNRNIALFIFSVPYNTSVFSIVLALLVVYIKIYWGNK